MNEEIEATLPEHLKDDASYIQCDKCGRKSYCGESINATCNMASPSGKKCNGVLKGKTT